ncbi:hypothetical protein TRFO_40238 [Tritrichomonas foetus]|uniref:Intimal thickness related receptor IRP domain-containing protein n=1 Tax=Tritrichomonas foetus TaxID=1144522 RepID=A0A1J4J756_9EUKA|nr:hypothetical protein TRFO_40238 [Tritrichomonas foetus]|eukprot:OHS93483.1 hypothetical protein TRFO_40238 [Tritrichomonas foetus]
MIHLLFYLYYRTTITLKPDSIAILPQYFTFQSGGNYSIFVDNAETQFQYLICSKKEFIAFTSSYDNKVCAINDYIVNKFASGVIQKSGKYQVLIYSNIQENQKATVTLHNPTSYLDAELQPCLFTKPIIAGLLGILFILWIINWLINFSLTFTLHEYLTITFLFTILYIVVNFFEYWKLHRSDDNTPLTQIRITLRFLHFWALFSAMLMASKGWCIVHNKLSNFNIIKCIVFSCLLAIPLIVMEYVTNLGRWGYLVLAFGTLGIILYYRDLLESIKSASAYVIAHLVVISESGIDPISTPIYSKLKIFQGVSWGVLLYFVFTFSLSLIKNFVDLASWIEQILNDFITGTLLVAAGILFRLKKELVNGYMMIGDLGEDSSSNVRTFARDDFKGFSAGSEALKLSGQREWEAGMTLPPQPVFVDDLINVSTSANSNEITENLNNNENQTQSFHDRENGSERGNTSFNPKDDDVQL